MSNTDGIDTFERPIEEVTDGNTFATNEGTGLQNEERERLLSNQTETNYHTNENSSTIVPKPSHRTPIGSTTTDGTAANTTAITTNPHSNDLESTTSDGPMRRQYEIQKDYRNFYHNSRILLIIVVSMSAIWFIISLISDFFFNFRFNNKLTSFNNIILLLISMVANSCNYIFNDIELYSQLDYSLNIILASLTWFNLVLLYLIKFTRSRLSFTDKAIYIWTIFTFILGATLDWQNHKYAIQLNRQAPTTIDGNDEMRQPITSKHTINEWLQIATRNIIKLFLLAALISLTLTQLLYTIDLHRTAPARSEFQFTDPTNNTQIHIRCHLKNLHGSGGEGNSNDKKTTHPIILYEHGGFDTWYESADWIKELYQLNRIDSYCVYERAGYGFSDSMGAPTSISLQIESLNHALNSIIKENTKDFEGADMKFVAVGFGYGGLFSRSWCAENLDLCDGMILVDSWHEDLLLKNYISRLLPDPDHDDDDGDDNNRDDDNDNHNGKKRKEWRFTKELGTRNGWKLWWKGFWNSFGLNLQLSWILKHHGSMDRILGREMKYQNRFLRMKYLETVTSSILSYNEIIKNNKNLKHVKTTVVSSKEMIRRSTQWGDWQRSLTKLSSNTKEWKIVEGDHEIYKYGLGKEQLQNVLLRFLEFEMV
ncbi:uncharacterized protein NDAI_0F02760 [Naumovozyma dairenensis CBS 421]|uniref:AB hydrolase-1 domain-containing protein n=1 Tax=Naumovozyma dairenensis (strain ATCC 10597 / BCRC 20456 / CBS 421 / NBRC 0211 / NRRL Y-12639) TaxID=1071378 RepID=G0WCT3_NAUDC|nr:hypothetical protein NDAI_0F02760 [Naumovozyma dairenensis CBS 421]CCD25594.1 hypothetical protein NDAI_0F02760 [Naumovozyma dairenensis CBS 421]